MRLKILLVILGSLLLASGAYFGITKLKPQPKQQGSVAGVVENKVATKSTEPKQVEQKKEEPKQLVEVKETSTKTNPPISYQPIQPVVDPNQEVVDYLNKIQPLTQEWAYWRDRINKLPTIQSIEQGLIESQTIMDSCYSLLNKIDAIAAPTKASLIKTHFVNSATNLAWAANAGHDMIAYGYDQAKLSAASSLMNQSLAQSDSEYALMIQEWNKYR